MQLFALVNRSNLTTQCVVSLAKPCIETEINGEEYAYVYVGTIGDFVSQPVLPFKTEDVVRSINRLRNAAQDTLEDALWNHFIKLFPGVLLPEMPAHVKSVLKHQAVLDSLTPVPIIKERQCDS